MVLKRTTNNQLIWTLRLCLPLFFRMFVRVWVLIFLWIMEKKELKNFETNFSMNNDYIGFSLFFSLLVYVCSSATKVKQFQVAIDWGIVQCFDSQHSTHWNLHPWFVHGSHLHIQRRQIRYVVFSASFHSEPTVWTIKDGETKIPHSTA